MNTDLVAKFASTLPPEDDHPYRTGAWRPQTSEWDADDLPAVEGEIPTDLDGVYLFDAARVPDGPVCKLALPERISSGTHSTWAPGSELRRWRE